MLFNNHFHKKLIPSIAFGFLLFLTFIAPAQAKEHRVIIGFHSKPGAAEEALMREHKGKIKHKFRHISAYAATVSDTEKPRLKKNPKVKYVVDDILYQLIEPVTAAAADPAEYDSSWGVKHIGSMNAHLNDITGAGVRVAILDTGMDYTHPELAINYQGGTDIVFGDSDPFDDSWNSHGTHVAGIIAAAANGSGVVGVAPDTELYAVKVLDGGGFGLLSWIIQGIDWAVDSGMDIVNISIGGPDSEALQDACDSAYAAGLLIVAAAGNWTEVAYPAAYDSVIAVTGTDIDDQQGWFAPFGSQIEFSAPGVFIQSTSAGESYAELSGTSQAAPHVSGLAALIYAAGTYDLNSDGIVDNKDVRLQMQQSTHDLGDTGRDETYGFGLINVEQALELGDNGSDPGIIFELIKEPKKNAWKKAVELTGAPYQITVTNTSLKSVRLIVIENGMLRTDLSETIPFKKNISQVASSVIDATGTTLQVIFEPVGKAGAYATVEINQ